MSRAPSMKVRPADGRNRTAEIAFPAAKSDCLPECALDVRAWRSPADGRPCLSVRPHTDLQNHRHALPDLWIDEDAALSAVVTWEISIEPEHLEIDGNASALGEPYDSETYAWIRGQLERGNQWAWCAVTVTARWLGHEGSDHLGGCSYASESDFTRPGGYYDDMRREAMRVLRASIEESAGGCRDCSTARRRHRSQRTT